MGQSTGKNAAAEKKVLVVLSSLILSALYGPIN
jgi:hypothetical protein